MLITVVPECVLHFPHQCADKPTMLPVTSVDHLCCKTNANHKSKGTETQTALYQAAVRE